MQHYSFNLPSVWESPRRIRFGIDTAVLTLRFTEREEAALTQLMRTGISASALHDAATDLDVPEERLATLLQRLSPVLTQPSREPRVFTMFDDFGTGSRIADALMRQGNIWRQRMCESDASATVAITVERFGYNPGRTAMLCSRGMSVLPVRFTDRTVSFGPVIDETALCTHCVHLIDVDAQAPWTRWPHQLIGVPIPAERALPAGFLASFVSEILYSHPATHTGHERIVVTYSPTGNIQQVHRETLERHHGCDRHSLGKLLITEPEQHVA